MSSNIYILATALCAVLWGLCRLGLFVTRYTEEYGKREGWRRAMRKMAVFIAGVALAVLAVYGLFWFIKSSLTPEQILQYGVYAVLAIMAIWCIWSLASYLKRKRRKQTKLK